MSKEPVNPISKVFDYLVGCAQVIGTIIGIIALIISFIGLVWAIRNQDQAIQIVRVIAGEPSHTPMSTYTSYPTYTPLPSQSSLETYAPIPTYTPPSTYTPFPTYTFYPEPTNTFMPSATPLPSVYLPFEDTFDLRPRPEWKFEGKWRVVNGKLSPDEYNSWVYAFVGDENWMNYSVYVDIYSCQSRPFRLIVRRREDLDTSMIVEIKMAYSSLSTIQFMLHKAGQDTPIGPANGIAGAGCGGRRYRVDVNEDIYSVFESDKLILRIEDNTLTAGNLGIGVNASGPESSFDNFNITELP